MYALKSKPTIFMVVKISQAEECRLMYNKLFIDFSATCE